MRPLPQCSETQVQFSTHSAYSLLAAGVRSLYNTYHSSLLSGVGQGAGSRKSAMGLLTWQLIELAACSRVSGDQLAMRSAAKAARARYALGRAIGQVREREGGRAGGREVCWLHVCVCVWGGGTRAWDSGCMMVQDAFQYVSRTLAGGCKGLACDGMCDACPFSMACVHGAGGCQCNAPVHALCACAHGCGSKQGEGQVCTGRFPAESLFLPGRGSTVSQARTHGKEQSWKWPSARLLHTAPMQILCMSQATSHSV